MLNSRARNVPRIFGCRPAFFSQIDDSAATSSSRRRLRRVLDIKWYHFFTRIKESWCSEYFIPLWRRRLRALSDARSAELARGGAGWVQSLQSHSRVSSSSRAPRRTFGTGTAPPLSPRNHHAIMSQQWSAIVAQTSSSARALKRSATPRGHETVCDPSTRPIGPHRSVGSSSVNRVGAANFGENFIMCTRFLSESIVHVHVYTYTVYSCTRTR